MKRQPFRVTHLAVVVTAWQPERIALVMLLRLFESAVPRIVADGMDRMASTVTAGLEIDGSGRAEIWLNSSEIIGLLQITGIGVGFQQVYMLGVQEENSPTSLSRTSFVSHRDAKWPADV